MGLFPSGEAALPLLYVYLNCIKHASYERSLVSFEKGRVVFPRQLVLRVICTSCQHTHAILPDVIIPYGSYSLSFNLHLMKEYYFHYLTVEKLCDRFCLSISTFYRLKHIYLSHRLLWLGSSLMKMHQIFLFI